MFGSNAAYGFDIGTPSATPFSFFTSNLERMRINSSGNVGIGTSSIFSILHVYGIPGFTGNNGILTLINANTTTTWSCGPNNVGSFVILNGAAEKGVILTSDSGSWGTYSDERLKRNIVSMDSVLSYLLQLRPVIFNYKSDIESEKPRTGFIAQEVEKIFSEDKHRIINLDVGIYKDDNGDTFNALGLSVTEMIPYMIKGMQEQQTQLTSLRTLVESQSELIASLQTQILNK